jgi:hypothetical protein
MAEQNAAQIHPVPAPEARRTLTTRELLTLGGRALDALEPLLRDIDPEQRTFVVNWVAEQYPRPVRAGAKPGRKAAK